jgi:glycosyltransferase involved in cell wall biosynthesis
MQGAQTESRFRGIGRYTMSFAQALVRNRGEHEIILALSGLFPDTIEPIREAFEGLLPQKNIRVWYALGPVLEGEPGNEKRREVAELIREAFLTSLQPDIIHITSLFEGYVDNAVTSIGRFDKNTPVTTMLYDLIPLINPEQYLKPNPQYAQYYQSKIDYLKQASRWLAISEFSRLEGIATLKLDETSIINISSAIEPVFKPQYIDEISAKHLKDKLGIHKPFILYTGGADERKNLPRLIEAYSTLPEVVRQDYQLVFAGKMPQGNIEQLKHIASELRLQENELIFTSYITDQQLVELYNLCTLYVFPSWHEGFGLPALEAMACGAPVIGANTTSLPEVIGMEAALFNPFNSSEMSQKIQQSLSNESVRQQLRQNGIEQARKFDWDLTAQKALQVFSDCSKAKETNVNQIYDQLLNNLFLKFAAYKNLSNRELLAISQSICWSLTPQREKKQILVDISELVNRDARTGIQRVVRSVLKQLLLSPPRGYLVEPVYANSEKQGYLYAKKFTAQFLGLSKNFTDDEPVDALQGDVFVALDLQHHVLKSQTEFLKQLTHRGVVVKTVIYDLLPVLFPHVFLEGAQPMHQAWLETTAKFDGVVCISKAVADEYQTWLLAQNIKTKKSFSVDWFHLGADIEASHSTKGLPANAKQLIDNFKHIPSFLMVGTLEPRKGHAQTLQAFNQLWQEGQDINLVIVGKQGWMVENLITKINAHPERNKRLFWLEGISDEFLEQVYSVSTCLIAASEGEGFGLPLIEAAQKKLPIIARDIPVFKEVAGEYAYYFDNSLNPEVIETTIQDWLELYKTNQHPKSDTMPWLTWEESAEQLLKALNLNKEEIK